MYFICMYSLLCRKLFGTCTWNASFFNVKHSATSWFWLILGNDVEVICGEWETGDKPYPTSGEDYNIVLQINSIVRHPGKCQYSIFNIVEST